MPKIVLLGDSTLDNQNWTHDEPCVTKHLVKLFQKSENTSIVNYAVDCFQTSDMLNQESNRGENAMRVVYLHPHFKTGKTVNVLDELSKVADVTHIVLSIGGNDIRNNLSNIRNLADMAQCIRDLQSNYIQIMEKIRESRPQAQFILMNQYIVDSKNDHYKIYEKLHSFFPSKSGVEVLQELMVQVYDSIFQKAAEWKLPIIDMASSLDHRDKRNYVLQIEPSSKASFIIASLIKKVVETHTLQHSSAFYWHHYKSNEFMLSNNSGAKWAPHSYAEICGPESREALSKPRHKQSIPVNYSFLMYCGTSFAAVASLASFAVAAIALAGIIALSSTGIGIVIAAGVVFGGLAVYGLYKAKTHSKVGISDSRTASLVDG